MVISIVNYVAMAPFYNSSHLLAILGAKNHKIPTQKSQMDGITHVEQHNVSKI